MDAKNHADIATQDAQNATNAAIETTSEAKTLIETMKSLIADDNAIHVSDLGIAGGVATLNENGNIPSSQLPSFVDDVLEGTATDLTID